MWLHSKSPLFRLPFCHLNKNPFRACSLWPGNRHYLRRPTKNQQKGFSACRGKRLFAYVRLRHSVHYTRWLWSIEIFFTVNRYMTNSDDRSTFGNVAFLSVSRCNLSNRMIHSDSTASKCYVNFHFVLKFPNKLPPKWLPNDNTNSIPSGINSILILSSVIQRLTSPKSWFPLEAETID